MRGKHQRLKAMIIIKEDCGIQWRNWIMQEYCMLILSCIIVIFVRSAIDIRLTGIGNFTFSHLHPHL